MVSESAEYEVYDVRCKDALDEEGVRFAAIVNKEGKKIAGGFKKGITPLEDNERELREFMKHAVDISLNKNYSKKLGRINYIVFRRDKIVLISFPFPLTPQILLISAEPSINVEKLAYRVTRIFGDEKLFSEWDIKST